MIVGMTGTRQGMTRLQKMKAIEYLRLWRPDICIHGCCHGADQEFHQLCAVLPVPPRMEGYPASPLQTQWAKARRFSEIHEGHSFLARDQIMAKRSDQFMGFPFSHEEIKRSGTWATIRMRRLLKKSLIIIFPDGKVQVEFEMQQAPAKNGM